MTWYGVIKSFLPYKLQCLNIPFSSGTLLHKRAVIISNFTKPTTLAGLERFSFRSLLLSIINVWNQLSKWTYFSSLLAHGLISRTFALYLFLSFIHSFIHYLPLYAVWTVWIWLAIYTVKFRFIVHFFLCFVGVLCAFFHCWATVSVLCALLSSHLINQHDDEYYYTLRLRKGWCWMSAITLPNSNRFSKIFNFWWQSLQQTCFKKSHPSHLNNVASTLSVEMQYSLLMRCR